MTRSSIRRHIARTLCVLAVTSTFLATSIARATESEPCTPDCPQSAWSSATFIALVPAPAPYQSCIMTVRYKTRLACGIWNDVQVVEIQFPALAGCTALNTWLNDNTVSPADKGAFMRKAQNVGGVAALSQEFTMMYNTGTPAEQQAMACPGGSSLWRIVRGSCWYLDRISCEEAVMRSCPNNACCLQNFTLCMGEDGVHITLNSTIVPQVPCGNPENPGPCATWGADGHCYFECDNDGIEDLLPPGVIKPKNDPDLSKSAPMHKDGKEEAHVLAR